jgi:LmbE family N-acetylglucosaminyl deacetylase
MVDIRGKKIIAISPHIDDVELGAGGSIYQLGKDNEIWYIALSLPPLVDGDTLMKEFKVSSTILGLHPDRIILKNYDPRNLFDSRSEILQLFYDLNQGVKPDLVFMPNSKDIHQSHEVVYAEARRAFKYCSILGYELPWNNFEFNMNAFVRLAEEAVKAKTAAINAYVTQKNRMFFSNDIVSDLARVRGKQIGAEFAECFEIARILL